MTMKTPYRLLLGLALLLAAGTITAQNLAGLRSVGSRIKTPVATNAWTAVSQANRVYLISVQNSSATDLYLHVFDTNGIPSAGATPDLDALLIPAGKTGGWDFGVQGCPFNLGVTIATSTTDRTLTNGTASFTCTVLYNK